MKRLAFLLLAVLAIDAAFMPGMMIEGDPSVWREETRSLLADGGLSVDAARASASGEFGQYFVLNKANGRWYSKYGVMNSLMSAPPMLLQRAFDGPIPPEGHKPDLLIYNLYNVLLSLLVCAMLYRVAGLYTARTASRAVFTLACLYATFLWYYQRAQSSEIYQVLFFLCFYDCLIRFLKGLPAGGQRALRAGWWAWLWVLALVLTRVLFGLLIVTFAAGFALAVARLDKKDRPRTLSKVWPLVALPPLLILAVLGAVDQIKFGSPWLSGYHQWRPQDHLPTGPMSDGLIGFLFSPQYSVFLSFPVLLPALFSLRPFVRKNRLDAAVLGATFLTFLAVLSKIPTWRGEWTFGPRYLLFLLPALSLPFVSFVDGLLERPRSGAWAALAVVLGLSSFLQLQANRLDFFAYYRVREPIRNFLDAPMRAYFSRRPFSVICEDLLSHRDKLDGLPYIKELERRAPPEIVQDYSARLRELIDRGNSYWGRDLVKSTR